MSEREQDGPGVDEAMRALRFERNEYEDIEALAAALRQQEGDAAATDPGPRWTRLPDTAPGAERVLSETAARTVALIACAAHQGCHHCAASLIDSLRRAFPWQAPLFEQVYAERYPDDC